MTSAKMWFGTEEHMRWIPCPVRGASVGPESWGVGGTLLSGGGFVKHSQGSARKYVFEWRSSSSRATAQTVHDFRDGVYGRGLIYFHDPLTYDTNVLPKQWAFPGLSIGRRDNPFLWGTALSGISTPAGAAGLPVDSVIVPLPAGATGLDNRNAVFVPIPPGFDLRLAAWYHSGVSTAGVYASPVDHTGGVGEGERVPASAPSTARPVGSVFSSDTLRGVWVHVSKTSSEAASVQLYGVRAILYPTSRPVGAVDGWMGGQGHSGCRFEGNPTYVNNTGVGGGQVSFAATFREVGDWL